MSVGNKIKQLRELRNYTQQYMADRLNMSLTGYGKIERDSTDISLQRLNQIAEILETTIPQILNFDSNQVFNQYNNKSATANGVVQNQQIISDSNLHEFFMELKNEINELKKKMQKKMFFIYDNQYLLIYNHSKLASKPRIDSTMTIL